MKISHANLGKVVAGAFALALYEEKYIELTTRVTVCVFRSGADKFNCDIIKSGYTIDQRDNVSVYDMASHLLTFAF